jgi:hypothetical protein
MADLAAQIHDQPKVKAVANTRTILAMTCPAVFGPTASFF